MPSPPSRLYLEDQGVRGDVVVVAVPLEAHLQGLRGIDLTKGHRTIRAHSRPQFCLRRLDLVVVGGLLIELPRTLQDLRVVVGERCPVSVPL